VPTRNSYTEWMRRVGQLCADLVVCDKGAQVIAVVEIRQPAPRPAPAVFPASRPAPAALPPIPVPTATALRGAGAASVVAAATSSGARPVAPAPATLDEVLEEIDRADAAAEFSLPEPTPSTWFDEYDSSPTPLQPARPKEPPNPR